jgi:hypothetical protein
MAQHTHLVVAYNHDTKTFWFDGDGSREWIRTLFEPETNTWSDEQGDFVAISKSAEQEAVDALETLGVTVEQTGWQTR